ncbi:MAG: hypothetical protein KGK08_13700, partial [Acidobacteriota bacterium]|nr:hypothetical protein [Acidobacteriota bacterium]
YRRIQLLGYPIMNTLVRAFVVVLVLTGAAASTQVSATTQTKAAVTSKSSLVPMCPPNDPNACGW